MNWRRAFLGITIMGLSFCALVGSWAREEWVERSLSWRHLLEAKFGDILIVGIYAVCSIVVGVLCAWLVLAATVEDLEGK